MWEVSRLRRTELALRCSEVAALRTRPLADGRAAGEHPEGRSDFAVRRFCSSDARTRG